MTTSTFAELGLAEPLLRALNDAEYTHPTPIQAKSIPVLLEGRDLLGLAETGTGKTAAFSLPLLHRLLAEGGRAQPGTPRALILAPTRELAIQIGESIATYGRHTRLSHTVIFGGVGQRAQVNAIARGVDILVATPGRLLDLVDQRHVRLNGVRTFILDEADRMLDMGFVRDVRRILKLVPAERHTLLFSATMPRDIAQLADDMLKNPARVEIARAGKTVDRIDQKVMFMSSGAKRDALARLLQDPAMRRVIVFTRTKRGADRVSQAIQHIGIGVHAIHGNKSQGQRQSALDSFRKGFTRVLVATDIAARGIDIDEITHVINYELPNVPESYVHRIGRTARAGAEGVAIALCAPDEREYLRDIERLTGTRLTVIGAPDVAEGATSGDMSRADDAGENGRHERPSRPSREGDRGEPRARRPERAGARSRDGGPQRGHAGGRDGERSREHGQASRHGEARRAGPRQGDRPHGDARPARNGDERAPRDGGFRRSSEGARDGETRRDGPRHGERPHRAERPARNGHGASSRDGEGRRGETSRGAHQGERQQGQAPQRHREARPAGDAPRGGRNDGERPQGNGHSARGGENRRSGSAPRNGEAGQDAPKPWRNWTRDGGVQEDGRRRDRSAGHAPLKRGRERPSDGGHGRGGRPAPRAER